MYKVHIFNISYTLTPIILNLDANVILNSLYLDLSDPLQFLCQLDPAAGQQPTLQVDLVRYVLK